MNASRNGETHTGTATTAAVHAAAAAAAAGARTACVTEKETERGNAGERETTPVAAPGAGVEVRSR